MDYQNTLDEYGKRVTECIGLSNDCAGISSPTGRHYYASVLFTRLCTQSYSLWELLPLSPRATKVIENWDYVTVASLTRNIIEAYLTFYYLCVEDIDDNEWRCRWNIFNLHDCTSRAKLFLLMEDQQEAAKFNTLRDELTSLIRSNEYFQTLLGNQQRLLLKGNDAFILSKNQIVERMGLERADFRWKYNFLSIQIHCLPMSFYRMGDQSRGRGVHSEVEEGYIKLFVEWAMEYLERAATEMGLLFKGVAPTVG